MKRITLISLGLFISIQVYSCQCMPISFEQEVERSNLIFHGRVTNIDGDTFTFAILDIWKGNFAIRDVNVTQGLSSCAKRNFQLGMEYVVYLEGMSVGNCSRTNEYDRTVDAEKLDLIFKNKGDEAAIASERLTDREFATLKGLLDEQKIAYPSNLQDLKVAYAYGHELISKRTFLDEYLSLAYLIRVVKVEDLLKDSEGESGYLIWVGYKPKGAFKKLKKKLRNVDARAK